MLSLKERIIACKQEHPDYGAKRIAKQLGCCEGTVRYYFSPGRKQRLANRCKQRGLRDKEELVKLAGGACMICGYNKYVRILQFHHLDRTEKDFCLSHTKSWSRKLEEIKKCVLLCPNCHAESHEIEREKNRVGLPVVSNKRYE